MNYPTLPLNNVRHRGVAIINNIYSWKSFDVLNEPEGGGQDKQTTPSYATILNEMWIILTTKS